jgi:NADH-quinone oxidoreductase subunit C
MDNEAITAAIKNEFSEAILSTGVFRNELTCYLKKEDIAKVAAFLKENKELDFDYLSDLCGVDRIETDGYFEVVYHLYSITKNHRIRLKVLVPSNEPCVPTVTNIWKTANWH